MFQNSERITAGSGTGSALDSMTAVMYKDMQRSGTVSALGNTTATRSNSRERSGATINQDHRKPSCKEV